MRAFDALTPIEQQQAAAEILRRSAHEGASVSQQESTPEHLLSQEDRVVEDWSAYYRLLLTGRLKVYGGRFIVVHQGQVVADGDDAEQLRSKLSKQLGVAEDMLVIPFVDDKECIAVE
jgi:hypothetical protein